MHPSEAGLAYSVELARGCRRPWAKTGDVCRSETSKTPVVRNTGHVRSGKKSTEKSTRQISVWRNMGGCGVNSIVFLMAGAGRADRHGGGSCSFFTSVARLAVPRAESHGQAPAKNPGGDPSLRHANHVR